LNPNSKQKANVRLPNDEQLYNFIYEQAPRFRNKPTEISGMVKKWRELINTAIEAGFRLVFRKNVITTGMFGHRIDNNGNPERFTYWITQCSVRTLLTHPKGRGELHRGREAEQEWTHEEFLRALKQPTGSGTGLRTHLNCGYRTKEQKKRNEQLFRSDRNE